MYGSVWVQIYGEKKSNFWKTKQTKYETDNINRAEY